MPREDDRWSAEAWLVLGVAAVLSLIVSVIAAVVTESVDALVSAAPAIIVFAMPLTLGAGFLVGGRHRRRVVEVGAASQLVVGVLATAVCALVLLFRIPEQVNLTVGPVVVFFHVLALASAGVGIAVAHAALVGFVAYAISPRPRAPPAADIASAPAERAPQPAPPAPPARRAPPAPALETPERPARSAPMVDFSGGEGTLMLEMLNERLARGEISLEEYRQVRNALSER